MAASPPVILTAAPLVLRDGLGHYRRRDYDELPDRAACELLLGRLYARAQPSITHQIVLECAWRQLRAVAAATGGRTYRGPVDLALAEHSVVKPDLFYLSQGQRDLLVDHQEGAPDLIVEVLSPETARQDRREKLALYAACGVKEYWLIDPEVWLIDLLVNEAGRFVVTLPSAGSHQSPAIAGGTLDVAAFWRDVEADWPRP
ncbi:MAG TPA: Uma2 family endonuclease [Thermoanaerobaculia bacterium]|nr:Uma2 family endonuclease [Thermoanaerobaculia bacterium]